MHIKSFSVAAVGYVIYTIAAEPAWHIARIPGTGCWPPRCDIGQVPLATPVVSHADRLFMIGDAAPGHVYESDDGINWRHYRHDAAWGARYQAAHASFGGALWSVGGFVAQGTSRAPMNDVWRSVDGRHWQRVRDRSPWSPRVGAHLVTFRDTLWLVGGEPNDRTLWGTTDGRIWVPRTASALPQANPQGVLVYNGALWILGHGRWDAAINDVWTSSDGKDWVRVTDRAGWPARTDAGFAVLGDRMWVVGGAGQTDVWSSTDGLHWQRAKADLPGPPRTADFSTVFRDAYWVFGGKTGGLGGTGFWDGVYYLR